MNKEQKEIIAHLRTLSGRKGGNGVKNRKYIMGAGDPTIRLSPQAVSCLEVMFEGGKPTYTEAELYPMFETTDKFTGKLGGKKVFQYYRKSLVKAGWFTIEKI